MNFHIKDDFKAGEPISSVPASWFNKVAGFLNNLVGVTGIKVNKPEKPGPSSPVTIELENADKIGTTPVAAGTTADDEVTQQEAVLWTSGGANGARLLVFYKSDTISGAGLHDLFAANLTISSDGRILRITAPKNKGIEIGA